jgi:hypothetical protein
MLYYVQHHSTSNGFIAALRSGSKKREGAAAWILSGSLVMTCMN